MQFVVVKWVARLAYYTWVKQKITISLIPFFSIFFILHAVTNTERDNGANLKCRVLFKFHSWKPDNCFIVDKICVRRFQGLDAIAFPGEGK